MAGPREALLEWFDLRARDLPWRRTRDPYAIWVSEVMLQQTRVETVIPYYERFLARFPTPEALAAASEDAVLAAWSGLGYYRRARLLHAGAKDVVARYGGEVPRGRDARHGLPGVGRYTAGAIGSIAFDEPEPIVDGNVARVLSRYHRVATPLGRADTEKRLWAEAERWALGPRPGALNQALMELGATVCVPSSPRCDACPLQRGCEARANGEQASLPVPKPSKPPRPVVLAAVVATVGQGEALRVLLVRGEDALFGGLYGVPMVETPSLEDARPAAEAALAAHGARARLGAECVARVGHVLSHRALDVVVFRATHLVAPPGERTRLFPPQALGTVGVARLTEKVLQAAGALGDDGAARSRGGARRRTRA